MDKKGQVTVITSGKGGVGKTTTSTNIGAKLAHMGKKVCLIDLDLGLSKLDLAIGVESRVSFDIIDVIRNKCSLDQALIKYNDFLDLYILPASEFDKDVEILAGDVKMIVDKLRKEFDYILVDCPAGIGYGFKNAIAVSDNALVVVNPEISSIRDADRVINILEDNGFNDINLIITRYQQKLSRRRDMMDIEDIYENLAIQMIGIIPEDENIVISTNKGIPLVLQKTSKAGKAYEECVFNFINSKSVDLDKYKKRGLFSSFKKKNIAAGV